MKQMEDGNVELHGQIVRVNDVVIPPWAKSRHHFIQVNYLALEHPRTRTVINDWIDLIFGDKQQRASAYNLFKPLTSEVSVVITIEICVGKRKGWVKQIRQLRSHPNRRVRTKPFTALRKTSSLN